MSDGKFVVGHLYYRCYDSPFDDTDDLWIETTVYKGIVVLECTSSSCDVPFHYYSFGHMPRRDGIVDEPIHIPNLKQAEQTMLTIDELMQGLIAARNGPHA